MVTTPFGTIITLDPALSRHLPENVQRLRLGFAESREAI